MPCTGDCGAAVPGWQLSSDRGVPGDGGGVGGVSRDGHVAGGGDQGQGRGLWETQPRGGSGLGPN